MTTAAGDPDLEHLFELLSMLPGPTEDRQFWARVRAHLLGDEDPESATRTDYAFEKVSSISRVILDPSPGNVTYLAKYLMVFFSANDPKLWKTLNRVTNRDFSLTHDCTGRWWARDVSETAWKLYVRYSYPSDERWKAKWQYEDGWTDWMPS